MLPPKTKATIAKQTAPIATTVGAIAAELNTLCLGVKVGSKRPVSQAAPVATGAPIKARIKTADQFIAAG